MLSASSLFTFVVSSLLLFPVLTAAAPAADFAALTVIPYGRQSYDIATGLTVLADGGEVQDRERGISLAGAVVRLREGVFIELEQARARGDSGGDFGGGLSEVKAERIRLEPASQTLFAEGKVELVRGGLSASAERLRVFFEDGVLVAEEVRSEAPALSGRALVVDLHSGAALLVGPYRLEDGPLSLVSMREDDLLELDLAGAGDALGVTVSTEPDPQRVARLGAYLRQ